MHPENLGKIVFVNLNVYEFFNSFILLEGKFTLKTTTPWMVWLPW